MSAVETGQMPAVETGQMSAAETGQMSAVETRQMSTIAAGRRPALILRFCLVATADIGPVSAADICPVSTADICPVSAEDICPVSAADICPVSTADICPVSTEDICPLSTADVLGGDENDFDPFFTPKMFKMEFIRRCPAEPGGARRNGDRDVETEPHQPRVMARITAVKQTPSNQFGHDGESHAIVSVVSSETRQTQ